MKLSFAHYSYELVISMFVMTEFYCITMHKFNLLLLILKGMRIPHLHAHAHTTYSDCSDNNPPKSIVTSDFFVATAVLMCR